MRELLGDLLFEYIGGVWAPGARAGGRRLLKVQRWLGLRGLLGDLLFGYNNGDVWPPGGGGGGHHLLKVQRWLGLHDLRYRVAHQRRHVQRELVRLPRRHSRHRFLVHERWRHHLHEL